VIAVPLLLGSLLVISRCGADPLGSAPRSSASPTVLASASPSPSPTVAPSPSVAARFRLTISVESAQYGKVISVPAGISCPGTCSATFAAGTVVSLQGVSTSPPPGYDMVWLDWTERCPGVGTTCEATMTSDQRFHAHFKLRPNSFQLTVLWSDGGVGRVTTTSQSISCGPTCITIQGAVGETVTLTVEVAGGGARFMGWSGGCTGSAPTCVITIPDSNVSVTANIQIPPPIPPP
jgi:hypothetical protein